MGIDVLAIGAHPDDVELTIGGTIAKLVAMGHSVALLDLTRGEMSSRGTPELRAKEAQAAANVLGAKERISLDMGDGILNDDFENRRQLIEVVRRVCPAIVMVPYWEDLHPDHAAAGRLVRSIMYPVGFANYPADGEPYRPNEVLFYMMHTVFEPSFIVDVDGYYEKKMEAIRCFGSQVGSKGGEDEEPPTNLTHPDFFKWLEGRARHYGSLIGRGFGEPFLVIRHVPMTDPVAHYEPFQKIYSSKK